ncbi:MAG: phosphatase PAP2 family protein [Bacteroidaceae bacterium]
MSNIEQLIEYDKEVTLYLNGSNSLFWDGFLWVFTSTVIWIPLVLTLLYVIVKNNKLKETLLIITMIALVIFLSDRISSGLFKPYFQRFRPAQDANIMYLIDIVNNYRGGRFGFISSHAANSFGVFTFIVLLIKNKQLNFLLLIWAILNSYSRIYLGVHYVGDILCGALLGCLVGYLVYKLYILIKQKLFSQSVYSFSKKHTVGGYLVTDVSLLFTVMYSTVFLIAIIGILTSQYKFF